MKDKLQRFVPTGNASQSEDAPGWGGCSSDESSSSLVSSSYGPICWKCRGDNDDARRYKKNKKQCPVCDGMGRLPRRTKEKRLFGRITRARNPPNTSTTEQGGPRSAALNDEDNRVWTRLVHQADTGLDVDVPLCLDNNPSNRHPPVWIPRANEELCRLTGTWRILQVVGSHRWTTDDLLTAFVAAQELAVLVSNDVLNSNNTPQDTTPIQYLDLGTGNGSVLQMVLWSALKRRIPIQALGVEARQEAVRLARRSLAFNLGESKPSSTTTARVEQGDFREYSFQQKYHLITGTPPYFRVDFWMADDGSNNQDGDNCNQDTRTVERAIIQQGGMPTAEQSAPARCEFRGGIEAYCQAAAPLLLQSGDDNFNNQSGRLVLCENWKNHPRVLDAARHSGLEIVRQVEVEGRPGRGTLFAVYVLQHPASVSVDQENQATTTTTRPITPTHITHLTVRDEQGNWTADYRSTVMNEMSIPAR